MSGALVAAVLTPGPRYLLRHTFSGAALAPSDLGPPFTVNGGVAAVSGGVLAAKANGSTTLDAVTLAANIVAQCRVNFGNSIGTDRRFEIQARASAANGDTISAVLHRTSGNVQIWRRDAGTATVLGTQAVTVADSTDYWLRLIVRASRIELLTSTDGLVFVSRLVVTEATYAANTGLAIRLTDNVASPTIIADDLMVWAA